MTMGTEGAVTFELRDGVAWLGLNRPLLSARRFWPHSRQRRAGLRTRPARW